MRPATRQDIVWIAQTMWQRGIDELKYWPGECGTLGVHPTDWLASWYAKIQKGDAVAFGPARPHAILGWEPERRTGVVETSFQASTSFEAPGVGLAITKEMRRAIPVLMKGRGVTRFNTYSLCINPEAERWFRLLGLTEDTNYKGLQCGPFLMRRFFRSL